MGIKGSYEEDKPNWREAFEQALAGGGGTASYEDCGFCRLAGVADGSISKCPGCPLLVSGCSSSTLFRRACRKVFGSSMDNSERRAICRHVLATVKDFTDRAEIRARIAEMLDDDAREKFLGKAESKISYEGYDGDSDSPMIYRAHWVDKHTPEFLYTIENNISGHIAAFRDEITRDRVLAFLNGEQCK